MFPVETQEMSREFFECWRDAGEHIDKQVDGGMMSWLKSSPTPPFLEHLSFRLGNQLFFVRVEDVDDRVHGPAGMRGLKMISEACNGHACLMPMKKKFLGKGWTTTAPGWGLLDAQTRKPLNPVELVSDERIEMTDWELQDMAVQVVKGKLEGDGFELMSWQGNPEVHPSIWFVGKAKKPEFVVVRAARYPEKKAIRPSNWAEIARGCSATGTTGHFASVALASNSQPFESADEAAVPLWRGHGMFVRFDGLE